MNTHEGFLGVKWGDDPVGAAKRLGVKCENWEPWEGGRGFEACFDIDQLVDTFGRKAYVRLFRSQNQLAGLSLRFMECGSTKDELADSVAKEFKLKETGDPLYTVFGDGAAVHLDYDEGDDTCELTVAGPRFGKAFADYVLEKGFKKLANGLRPR